MLIALNEIFHLFVLLGNLNGGVNFCGNLFCDSCKNHKKSQKVEKVSCCTLLDYFDIIRKLYQEVVYIKN